MLSESLGGIATIRANDAVGFFREKFRDVHDAHGKYRLIRPSRFDAMRDCSRRPSFVSAGQSFFAFISCSRWLGFRMDALMFVFLAIASFAAVLVHQQAWFDIDPGILGLAISMLIQLSGLFR